MRRRIICTVAVTVTALAIAGPVRAGGSWFESDRERYAPGETATFVGHTGGGQLGWVEDGPFEVYLRVDPATAAAEASAADAWPFIASTDVHLGRLEIEERRGAGNRSLSASITFEVPGSLAPGRYELVYCNDPCTTGLGDLIGGVLDVTGRSAAQGPRSGARSLWPLTGTVAAAGMVLVLATRRVRSR